MDSKDTMDIIIKSPYVTEKALMLADNYNIIQFIVDRRARKQEIKKQVESLFKVKVVKVRTLIDSKGRKRAMIKLSRENSAKDLLSKLGAA